MSTDENLLGPLENFKEDVVPTTPASKSRIEIVFNTDSRILTIRTDTDKVEITEKEASGLWRSLKNVLETVVQ